ncbi:PREDICTED: zinc-finger homeodomain protein 1-like [Ipomoea nil]|uniref:zinc-finger homeodomain protein 1-like n=1 Tax=Ipomoea nil TaxID=35883 RepID=UPI000901BAF9|nr:PREDICTED: zinc-finger homeodomain protein 1-like [Ipomoea nil]
MNPPHPFSTSPRHSSSSSQEDDDDLIAIIQSQQQALLSTYAHNNAAMAYCLEIMCTQANPSHGGSTLGHRVIHRETSRMALTGEGEQIGGGIQGGVDDAPPRKQENSVAGPRVIRYRECLKNHAVSIGGSVTDGCGEFMPGGEEGTVASLKCAACNCHRSFHRQETTHGSGGGGAPPTNPPALPSFASMTHRHNAWASLAAQSPKTPAFGGAAPPTPSAAAAATAAAVDSSFQEPNFSPHKCFPSPASTAAATVAETRGKKRFRTKFTAEQKEKMSEFADKIGWRIPREEENIHGVERFCGEIGVKRQVFKVWMHNNKSSAKPNAATSHPPLTTTSSSSSSINN